MTSQALADELRGEIAKRKRTQKGLAEVLGVTEGTVSRKFADGSFTMPEVFKAAGWLGVKASELMRRAEDSDSGEGPQAVAS